MPSRAGGRGGLEGTGVEELPDERWDTAFELRLLNVQISEGDPPAVSAWAEGGYATPEWTSSVPEFSKTYEVETPVTAGVIRGHLHLDAGRSWMALDYRELLPVVKTGTITGPRTYSVGPTTDDLLGTDFQLLPESPSLALELSLEEDVIRMSQEYDDGYGMRARITGALYRVSREEPSRPEPGGTVRTDQHTRKTLVLSDEVEIVINAGSEVVVHEELEIEVVTGEVFARIRRPLTPRQLRIRAPRAVAAPRDSISFWWK